MKCQRCLSYEEAGFVASTDAMEMKVCAACAEEARKLGIAVKALGFVKGTNLPSLLIFTHKGQSRFEAHSSEESC